MEQKKQPTYYFPVHIHASTLCKLFTSKPSTSKKKNVLGMEELFPCKKRLNKLRLFILEKRQLREKKKKNVEGLKAMSGQESNSLIHCSLLLSIHIVRAIKGGQLIQVQNKQAVIHSYVAEFLKSLTKDVVEAKILPDSSIGLVNTWKRYLERVRKQTNHSGLKSPEPEYLKTKRYSVERFQTLALCIIFP